MRELTGSALLFLVFQRNLDDVTFDGRRHRRRLLQGDLPRATDVDHFRLGRVVIEL